MHVGHVTQIRHRHRCSSHHCPCLLTRALGRALHMTARGHRRQETALHVAVLACCVEMGHSCQAAPIASPATQQTINTSTMSMLTENYSNKLATRDFIADYNYSYLTELADTRKLSHPQQDILYRVGPHAIAVDGSHTLHSLNSNHNGSAH